MIDAWMVYQSLKGLVYVVWAILLLFFESGARFAMTVGNIILPISLIDWCRASLLWKKSPRLLRGFRDEELFSKNTNSNNHLLTDLDLDLANLSDVSHSHKQNSEKNRHKIRKRDINSLLNCNTRELIEARPGFVCEEHMVTTKDGFRLILHRLFLNHNFKEKEKEGEKGEKETKEKKEKGKIILWHGLMQSSECFVAQDWSLAFLLAKNGYDVFLGNSRGNRYSCLHNTLSSSDEKYWNFSLDEIANYDIPASVDYVLSFNFKNKTKDRTKKDKKEDKIAKVDFIGFSQATASILAALSINSDLKSKIRNCICLAPTIVTHGFKSRLIDSLAKSSPDCIYLLFGKGALLSTVSFWQDLLSVRAFCYLIDGAFKLLFHWKMNNILPEDKPLLYFHLYSSTSVKSVVHWFKCVKTLQFYDDSRWVTSGNQRKIPNYPLDQLFQNAEIDVSFSENENPKKVEPENNLDQKHSDTISLQKEQEKEQEREQEKEKETKKKNDDLHFSLFCGGQDGLSDFAALTTQLGISFDAKTTNIDAKTTNKKHQNYDLFVEETFEHMDFLFARSAVDKIYPKIISILS